MDDQRLFSPKTSNEQILRSTAYAFGPLESLRKLLALEPASQDPWLEEFADERQEALKLELNRQHALHSYLNYIYDGLLTLASLRWWRPSDQPIGAQDSSENSARLFNTLKIYGQGIATRSQQSAPQLRPKRPRWPLLVFAILFSATLLSALDILCFSVSLFKHDVMLSNLRPTVSERPELVPTNRKRRLLTPLPNRPRLNESDLISAPREPISPDGQCAIVNLIDNGERFNETEFINLTKRLEEDGGRIRSHVGTTFLTITLIPIIPFIYYLLPQLYIFQCGPRLRFDTLAFLRGPLLERQRLVGEQQQIVQRMISSFMEACRENELAQRTRGVRQSLTLSSQHQAIFRHIKPEQLAKRRHSGPEVFYMEQDRLARRSLDHPDNVEFIEILLKIRANVSEYVRPIVVNSEWHYLKQMSAPFILAFFVLICFLTPELGLLASYSLELMARVHDRLQAIECARWHPQGVLLRPNLYLMPTSELEFEPHALYDGSIGYLLYLMLLELRTFFDWPHALFAGEWFLLTVFLPVWPTLWGSIYILGTIDKFAWLVQVERQLSWCANESRAIGQEHELEREVRGLKRSERRHRLLERLTSVFVHYQLYKLQHKPHRMISNFVVSLLAILTALTFADLYLISTNMQTRLKFFTTIVSAAIIMTFDFYMILSSLLPTRMEYIMRDLVEMLAQLAHKPQLIVVPTLDIWRRQLLADYELQIFSSTRVLGISITYKKIVAFNVQLLAIWLLLWNVISFAPTNGRQ